MISTPAIRRPTRLILAVGALVVAAAVAVPVLAFGGGEDKPARTAPIGLIRLNGHTGRVVRLDRGATSLGNWNSLQSQDGTLWQYVSQKGKLLERDARTGRIEHSLPVQIQCACQVSLGFGSIWLLGNDLTQGAFRPSVTRIDEVSGRTVKRIGLTGSSQNGTIATGNGAVWVLESGGELLRIDPISNRVTRTYETHAVETNTLVPLAGFDWICECEFNKILRFDPRSGHSTTFRIPTQAYLVGIDSSHGQTLWLLDPKGSTLTAVNPRTGRARSPLGLSGDPVQAVVAFGSMWAAAGKVVDRVDLTTNARSTIAMPKGVWAGSIAANPSSGAIWVGNSGSAPPPH